MQFYLIEDNFQWVSKKYILIKSHPNINPTNTNVIIYLTLFYKNMRRLFSNNFNTL